MKHSLSFPQSQACPCFADDGMLCAISMVRSKAIHCPLSTRFIVSLRLEERIMSSPKHLTVWMGALLTFMTYSGALANGLLVSHCEDQFSSPIFWESIDVAKLHEPAINIRVPPRIVVRRRFFFRNIAPGVHYFRELAAPPLHALKRMAIIERESGRIVSLSNDTICRRVDYCSTYPKTHEFNPTAWIIKNSLKWPSIQGRESSTIIRYYAENPSNSPKPIALQKWINQQGKYKLIFAKDAYRFDFKQLTKQLGTIKLPVVDTTYSESVNQFLNRRRPLYPPRSSILIVVTDKPMRLSKSLKAGLRKYLIDVGGLLLIINTDNRKANDTSIKGMLRYVMPEYEIIPLEASHEIYQTPYNLGAPIRGYHAEGIHIEGKLSVLYTTHNYWGAWLSENPDVDEIRFGVNVIHYAISHGGIAEFSRCPFGLNVQNKIDRGENQK